MSAPSSLTTSSELSHSATPHLHTCELDPWGDLSEQDDDDESTASLMPSASEDYAWEQGDDWKNSLAEHCQHRAAFGGLDAGLGDAYATYETMYVFGDETRRRLFIKFERMHAKEKEVAERQKERDRQTEINEIAEKNRQMNSQKRPANFFKLMAQSIRSERDAAQASATHQEGHVEPADHVTITTAPPTEVEVGDLTVLLPASALDPDVERTIDVLEDVNLSGGPRVTTPGHGQEKVKSKKDDKRTNVLTKLEQVRRLKTHVALQRTREYIGSEHAPAHTH